MRYTKIPHQRAMNKENNYKESGTEDIKVNLSNFTVLFDQRQFPFSWPYINRIWKYFHQIFVYIFMEATFDLVLQSVLNLKSSPSELLLSMAYFLKKKETSLPIIYLKCILLKTIRK